MIPRFIALSALVCLLAACPASADHHPAGAYIRAHRHDQPDRRARCDADRHPRKRDAHPQRATASPLAPPQLYEALARATGELSAVLWLLFSPLLTLRKHPTPMQEAS